MEAAGRGSGGRGKGRPLAGRDGFEGLGFLAHLEFGNWFSYFCPDESRDRSPLAAGAGLLTAPVLVLFLPTLSSLRTSSAAPLSFSLPLPL